MKMPKSTNRGMKLPKAKEVDKPLPGHFDPDMLGILVFGPGHGEAIVVMFPDATLAVIDGCREPSNPLGDPVSGFIDEWHQAHPELHGRIRFVALTHPHADHYGGLGKLIERHAEKIDRIWSTLPTGDRHARSILKYMEMTDGVMEPEYNGLERVHDAMRKNLKKMEILQRGPHNTTIVDTKMGNKKLQVSCLAPSSQDILRAQGDLVDTLRRAHDSDLRPRSNHDANLISSALLIKWGDSQVLLGGDVLCAHGSHQGWGRAAEGIKGKVQVVKAAHHASTAAQDWDLLQRMAPALTVVTPFKYGDGQQPPQKAELDEISKTTRVALTCPPRWLKPARVSGRNSVLSINRKQDGVQGKEDAVGVCLDPKGRITKIVLAGRARYFDG